MHIEYPDINRKIIYNRKSSLQRILVLCGSSYHNDAQLSSGKFRPENHHNFLVGSQYHTQFKFPTGLIELEVLLGQGLVRHIYLPPLTARCLQHRVLPDPPLHPVCVHAVREGFVVFRSFTILPCARPCRPILWYAASPYSLP